jgi:hypothetical protein
MPTAASRPRVSGSTASSGSSWTTCATCSKNDASVAGMVQKDTPETFTKFIAGGFVARSSG